MNSLIDRNLKPESWLIEQNSQARQLLKNPLLKKDVWHTINDLGLEVYQHKRILTINFKKIQQDWLKLLIKLYTLLRSQLKLSPSYIYTEVLHLSRFSTFLINHSILVPEQIDFQVFEEFERHLQTLKLSEKTIIAYQTTLKNFFNVCNKEEWLNINTYWFDGKIRQVKIQKLTVKYIPEDVWQQLDKHLHHLPEPLQRMVLIIRATGLRIGELLNLPLDCLRHRNNQWRLRFLTEKYKIVDEMPICDELVAIIQEQQEYIKQHFKNDYDNLFGSNASNVGTSNYIPAPKVMLRTSFNHWLNKLAKNHNICTQNGELWHFQSHQFRRTVATVMDNAGVRSLIIQKYLRHRSPDMQDHYKHLLKEVLGEEYQELMKETKYVDSTGKLVATHKPKNPITEMIRQKMYQVTTQYGECHRPQLKSPCQTVNACWRCEHWRTSTDDLDYLNQDLARLDEEIKIAHQLGMVRQEKGLISDQKSLQIHLQGLEVINNGN
ncbi:tyrosine-type recombinase/integrase [Crocosphaera sp. XPORK-15E]|uniref:tyrosine-type recombinase/integrase n=1 Tax=Crocosphaera sp. XPORK-15E TaxID=3110247 RepID=UPI002B1FA825|nr:tyrosine-type recombinase/integrase [Crocosphaera sp. XPORK-15E]MEA5536983.1 tyrosine-type recombinase/integrase [Crocosphaera sp. XPORK-15E]